MKQNIRTVKGGENELTARLGIVHIIKLGTLFALCIVALLPLLASAGAALPPPIAAAIVGNKTLTIVIPDTGVNTGAFQVKITSVCTWNVTINGYAANPLPGVVGVTFPSFYDILEGLKSRTDPWTFTVPPSAPEGTYPIEMLVYWSYDIGGGLQTGYVVVDPTVKLVKPVGGIVVPVDKFGLLAPHIAYASTILAATVASTVYVKRVKRRKEKQ
jgi:hypothetical protein